MAETLETKKEILILYQAAVPKVVMDRVDRRMRAAFARLEGADGTVPSRGIYKIRADEQHPWRVIFKRSFEAGEEVASIDDVLAVLQELEAAVRDELSARRALRCGRSA